MQHVVVVVTVANKGMAALVAAARIHHRTLCIEVVLQHRQPFLVVVFCPFFEMDPLGIAEIAVQCIGYVARAGS